MLSSSNRVLLEAGCGSASYFSFGSVAQSVGIDIDQDQLAQNATVQEKILGDLQTFPLPREEFDVVVCWDVIEHLSRPRDALRNMFQTLKPGGLLILGFPHLLSFKGMATKMTPFWVHEAVYRHMKYTSRHFPTCLRAAILPRRVIRLAEEHGFSVAYYGMIEDGFTQRLRQRYWILNVVFRSLDAIWQLVTLGKRDSLLLDNCALILQKGTSGQKSVNFDAQTMEFEFTDRPAGKFH